MKRVTHPAEESNAIPTANKQNNSTAFTGSVSEGNVSNKSSGGEENKTHGFSKTLAEIKNSKGEPLGYNAAIILRYLSAISRKYGSNIDGKRWVRVNLDHISEQYPYMGRSTVDDNIIRLEQFGCCEKQNGLVELKRRKNDRTRCYHIPKKWMDAAEDTPRYFNSAVAQAVKVPAAVIYYNFCHWIGECKERKVESRVKLSPATLVELLPFSESTVKRSLKTLEAEKYIHPVPGKICWYAETIQELRGSKPDDKGPNPDEKGPNPDEKGPNPDNYIDCNELVDELEKNSKPKPAASVFENPADDKKANDDKSHLFDDGIAASADGQDRKEMEHDNIAEPASNPSSEQAKATSTGSENNSSSTSDIPGEAFDVKGEWPDVPNYEYLRSKNQSLSALIRKMEDMPGGVRDSLLSTVHDICVTVLFQVDQQITDELFANADKEEIVQALLPYHQQFFGLSNLTTEHPLLISFIMDHWKR